MDYKNISEALEQLQKCNFEDGIGHPLENNTAFIYLKELSEKFPMLVGDKVEVEVFGEIAGVRTSVKKTGTVLKMERTMGQLPIGKKTYAFHHIHAYIYNEDSLDVNGNRNKKEEPFLKKMIWSDKNA